jgi:N-acetylmuramoyl-L-alanine amidase
MIFVGLSYKMDICKEGGEVLRGRRLLILIFIFFLSFTGLQPIQKTLAENNKIKINSNQTNVREGPGLSYSKIGQVNQGDTFPVLKINGDWIQIELKNKKKGWVANWLVTFEQNKKQTSSSSLQKGAFVSVNANGLRVRTGPGTSYKVIDTLNKGVTAEIRDSNEDWINIDYSGKSGWVSAEFVELQTKQNEPQKQAETKPRTDSKKPEGNTGTVTATTLYVRSQGSQDGKVIGKVFKGDKFKILDEENNWLKIKYKSGSYGWVAGWYIEKSAASSSSGTKLKDSTITILYNGTNIRKSPSVQAEVVQRANQDDVFETVRLTNDWYEIRLKNGGTAYVAGWVVTAQGTQQQVEKPGSEIYLKNKTIIIDPGHGGRDVGTLGYRGTFEKNITIQTATLLADRLKAAGANVILTRSNDTYISLSSRVRASHINGADAFISIHYDSIEDKTVRGTTSFYYHTFQKGLASSLHSAVLQYTNLKDRGVRYGDYHVLRENKQYAVLLELGYLSNPTEEILIKSQQFQEQAAIGIFQGLAGYFKK